MQVEDLYQYLGNQYEVTCDSRLCPKGTVYKIKSIDIRKFDNRIRIRFCCIKNNDKIKDDDAYLEAYEFIDNISLALKKID